MKKLIFSICVLAVFLGGCSKKCADSSETKNTSTKNITHNNEIPVYDSKDEKFFDIEIEDENDNYVFVDKEQGEEGEILISKREEEVIGAEDDWSDEFSLTWEDGMDSKKNDVDESFKVVKFDLNKNTIRDDQKTVVAENVRLANNLVKTGKKLVVNGHCCPMGSPSFNMSLSEKRAKTIRDEMVKNGVPEQQIKIVGCGSEIPIVLSDATDKNKKIEELAPNRRAEISEVLDN